MQHSKKQNFDEITISIASSVGSLSIHTAPSLAFSASMGENPLKGATLISSILLGQFISALLLGLRPSIISHKNVPMVALCALSTLMPIILIIDSGFIYFTLWLIVGIVCGALMSTGIVTAAMSKQKERLFAVRLASALILSALCLLASIPLSLYIEEHKAIVASLAVVSVGIILPVANYLGHHTSENACRPLNRVQKLTRTDLLALLAIVTFYAGAFGFFSSLGGILENTSSQGFIEISFALFVTKISVGITLLLLLPVIEVWAADRVNLALLCFVGSATPFLVSISALGSLFAVSFFDLALNVSAVILLGRLSKVISIDGRNLILLSIFGGSAIGPMIFVCLAYCCGYKSLYFGFAAIMLAVVLCSESLSPGNKHHS